MVRALRRLPVPGVAASSPPPEGERPPIEMEISRLENASLDELRLNWRNRWGRLAPAHISRGSLFRLTAYRIQVEAFGDLDRNVVKALDRWDRDSAPTTVTSSGAPGVSAAAPRKAGRPPRAAKPSRLVLKPGAVLTREWQGRTETVMTVEGGFAWNGKVYPSLSAVALAITGVKWSGQRFFFGAKGRGGGLVGSRERSLQPSKRDNVGLSPSLEVAE
jgi:Protein of unknown function (DUF2924)